MTYKWFTCHIRQLGYPPQGQAQASPLWLAALAASKAVSLEGERNRCNVLPLSTVEVDESYLKTKIDTIPKNRENFHF